MQDFNPMVAGGSNQQLSVGAVSVEMSRAAAEIHAKISIAKSFPRNMVQIKSALQRECNELAVANGAFYSFGRGSSMASGLSIRAAEMLARCFTNIDYGVIELSRTKSVKDGKGNIVIPGESEMMAFAWDVENNVRKEIKFTVSAVRDRKGGGQSLDTERDIYENNSNMGTRRLRNCILALVPAELKQLAEDMCKKTLSGGTGKSLAQRAEQMVMTFAGIGVTTEMIEGKLGHTIDSINADDIATLSGVWQALKDGGKIPDHFDYKKIEEVQKEQINNDGEFNVMKVGE